MTTSSKEPRVGQFVRIQWPNGCSVEGKVALDLCVYLPDGTAYNARLAATQRDGRTVTVLSEPRPAEPTGLGAVVEAVWANAGKRQHWVREPWGGWVNEDGFRTEWHRLIDPVVLSEGWVEPLEEPKLHGFADAYGTAECRHCLHTRKRHSLSYNGCSLCPCSEFEL